jgi:hypothetical protein
VDTAGAAVSEMVVIEPYIYWVSDGVLGRTNTQAEAPGQILVEPCFPYAFSPVADATGLYWTASTMPFQGALLGIDLSDDSAAEPSQSVFLQGQVSGSPFGVDARKVYLWSGDTISAIERNTRCHCACAGPGPNAALMCETADGVTPAAPGSGGSPGYYEDCGGQQVQLLFRGNREQITGVAMDADYLYWHTYYGIWRIAKDSPNLLDPLSEGDGDAVELIPHVEPGGPQALITAFALDETSVYAYRGGWDSTPQILRVSKSGSEPVTLYERPLGTGPVQSMLVDEQYIYLVATENSGCSFRLIRLPKEP